jgi:uncharacterized protein YcfL
MHLNIISKMKLCVLQIHYDFVNYDNQTLTNRKRIANEKAPTSIRLKAHYFYGVTGSLPG